MQLANGMDDRRNAFIFTCARWSEVDTYIVLPLNPSTFEVSNPIRGTQGETQRGKFMYVHRNPKSQSVIAPCNYTFEIPSGFILPQFSDDYIKQARDLSLEYAKQMKALRNYVQPWTRPANPNDTSPDQVDSAAAAEQRNRMIETQVSKYQARAGNFVSQYPSEAQTKNYTEQSQAFNLSSTYIDPYNNIPNLYRENVPIGIQNFYAFIALMDEPRVYKSPVTGKLQNNPIIIHFNSPELPAMTFWGWQDQGGLNYTEDVEDYGQFNIQFSIFVTASDPAFGYGKFATMMSRYKAEVASASTSLDRLKQILKSTKPNQL